MGKLGYSALEHSDLGPRKFTGMTMIPACPCQSSCRLKTFQSACAPAQIIFPKHFASRQCILQASLPSASLSLRQKPPVPGTRLQCHLEHNNHTLMGAEGLNTHNPAFEVVICSCHRVAFWRDVLVKKRRTFTASRHQRKLYIAGKNSVR